MKIASKHVAFIFYIFFPSVIQPSNKFMAFHKKKIRFPTTLLKVCVSGLDADI